MNTIELNGFINKIKDENSFDEAHLGFFLNDEHDIYTCHIKGNKQGLILYAIELIEASMEIEKQILNDDRIYNFYKDWDSFDSDISISHIELSEELNSEIKSLTDYKETWKDQLMKFFLIGIFIFILISILVGAFTILSWMF